MVPGSGVAYTYYFDPNEIDGTNTDSHWYGRYNRLEILSGTYLQMMTHWVKARVFKYDFGGGNLLTWTKASAPHHSS